MKHSASIKIRLPQQELFDRASDPTLASGWNKNIKSFEGLTGGVWGPKSQAIWTMNFAGDTLEVIETCIECSRPNMTASSYEFSRFIPPTPAEIREKGLPRINYEYDLAQRFRSAFGKYRPHGIIVNEFIPLDESTTVLRITDDQQMGGYMGFMHRLALLFRRKPALKILKQIKAKLESPDGPKTEQSPHD